MAILKAAGLFSSEEENYAEKVFWFSVCETAHPFSGRF
jgi:hypothetical protein